jgi:STE24 endopeptidase
MEPRLEKAKKYQKLNNYFSLLDLLLTMLFISLFIPGGRNSLSHLLAGMFQKFFSSKFILVSLYIFALLLIKSIFFFPFDYYTGHLHEKKFQLSNQDFGQWLKDKIKALALSMALSIAAVNVLYFFLEKSPALWWVYCAAVWLFFSVVLAMLFPVLIIPMFFRLKKMEKSDLTDRLYRLSEKVPMQILGIYEIDLSRKTQKANAALTGLFSTKKILLGDTLLREFSSEEIESVVAHEMGHFRHRHIWKLVFLNTVFTFAGLYAVHLLTGFLNQSSLYSGRTDLAAFPVLALLLLLLSGIFHPLMNIFSRYFEKEADAFSLSYTSAASFISCMEKLGNQNLSDPNPSPVIEFLLYSHPSIGRRIAHAKNIAATTGEHK